MTPSKSPAKDDRALSVLATCAKDGYLKPCGGKAEVIPVDLSYVREIIEPQCSPDGKVDNFFINQLEAHEDIRRLSPEQRELALSFVHHTASELPSRPDAEKFNRALGSALRVLRIEDLAVTPALAKELGDALTQLADALKSPHLLAATTLHEDYERVMNQLFTANVRLEVAPIIPIRRKALQLIAALPLEVKNTVGQKMATKIAEYVCSQSGSLSKEFPVEEMRERREFAMEALKVVGHSLVHRMECARIATSLLTSRCNPVVTETIALLSSLSLPKSFWKDVDALLLSESSLKRAPLLTDLQRQELSACAARASQTTHLSMRRKITIVIQGLLNAAQMMTQK